MQRLVVVISSIENNDVLERWQFDIECDRTAKDERLVTKCFLAPALPCTWELCRHKIKAVYTSTAWLP